MKIVLTGPKGTGKSTCGAMLAKKLHVKFIETDEVIEEIYAQANGKELTCREICREEGEVFFRELEKKAIQEAAGATDCVISTGGSTFLNPESVALLKKDAVTGFLFAKANILWERIISGGIPSYLKSDDPKAEFCKRIAEIVHTITPLADIVIDTSKLTPEQVLSELNEAVREHYAK